MNNYKYHSPNTLDGDLEIMIHKTLLNYETLKNVIFNPYLKYRDDITVHLKNYESDNIETHITNYECKYEYDTTHLQYDGHYSNNKFSQLTNTLMNNAKPIISKHRQEFIEGLEHMWSYSPTNWMRIIDDEDERDWGYFIVLGMLDLMYKEDIFFQFKFTKLLRRLEEDYKNKIIQQIAFQKIKRNKIFILGLSMKLSMRDCGIILVN